MMQQQMKHKVHHFHTVAIYYFIGVKQPFQDNTGGASVNGVGSPAMSPVGSGAVPIPTGNSSTACPTDGPASTSTSASGLRN